jgi:cation diffusion facilitator family transporter
MQKGRDNTGNGRGTDGALKVVLAALAGNLEGIHSLVDTADQVLLLIGQRRAARPPDVNHPFGYGMETYFWTFIVALMIFLAGGAVAIWEGVEKVLHPTPVSHPWVSFGVLAASALFEGLSFRTAYREYRHIVRGRDIRLLGFLRDSKDPNVFATILEDGTALTGLALAAAGVAGSTLLGWRWADGVASVLIGLLLVGVAVFLANETRSLIAGEAAVPSIEERVRRALDGCAHLGELARLRTLHLGPQSIERPSPRSRRTSAPRTRGSPTCCSSSWINRRPRGLLVRRPEVHRRMILLHQIRTLGFANRARDVQACEHPSGGIGLPRLFKRCAPGLIREIVGLAGIDDARPVRLQFGDDIVGPCGRHETVLLQRRVAITGARRPGELDLAAQSYSPPFFLAQASLDDCPHAMHPVRLGLKVGPTWPQARPVRDRGRMSRFAHAEPVRNNRRRRAFAGCAGLRRARQGAPRR